MSPRPLEGRSAPDYEPVVSTPRLLAVYPSGGEVPVNLLKIYLHFSAPMREGQAAGGVALRRADTGEALQDVFLQGPELWDPERRRLTVLFDPGRIKRGLVPHEEAGYPLQKGSRVALTVDRGFLDAHARPLREAFAHEYLVVREERRRVDPGRWVFRPPAAGTRESLAIAFGRPLDQALLQRGILVVDARGEELAGDIFTGAAEESWRFTPNSPWKPGPHLFIVEPWLEDLAGNSPARVFDVDLARPQDHAAAQRLGMEFTPAL